MVISEEWDKVGGKEGFLLTFDKGENYQTSLYKDANYNSYVSSPSGSNYTKTYTFLKKVKGFVCMGPYASSITGTADITQITSDVSNGYIGISFEADANETIIVKNIGWSAVMCAIFITEE